MQSNICIKKVNENIIVFYKKQELYDFSSTVIIKGNEAFVFDTLDDEAGGLYIRRYLESEYGINNILVINSHWHWDHIGGNDAFADKAIIAHQACRKAMEENKVELDERFNVIYPSIIFKDRLTLYVGNLEIELFHTIIHSKDSIAAYIKKYQLLIAGDILEAPFPYIDEVEDVLVHLNNMKKLRDLDIKTIIPSHGKIYGNELLEANIAYLEKLITYKEGAIEEYAADNIEKRTGYTAVHENNLKLVKEYFS